MDDIIDVAYMREGKLYATTSLLSFVLVVEIQILSFLRESGFWNFLARPLTRSNFMRK